MFTVFLIFSVILFLCFDLIHIFRTIIAFILSGRRSSLKLLDENVKRKICLPLDLDTCLHMNNTNYLRHSEIARLYFWKENGVLSTILKLGGSMTLGGNCNRYRREINLFTKYTIHTKVIHWDDSAFYLEQTFVRDSDGFVCFISLVKQTMLKVKPQQIIDALGYDVEKPEMLPELCLWIESTSSSSERLRKKA